jgi:hypothetical protein
VSSRTPTSPADRSEYLLKLDDQLLIGGVILSEWCSFIVKEADLAFLNGANLGCILTAVAGIETYLRSECPEGNSKSHLVDLIESASIDEDLRQDLHKLRRYRNRWVHVNDPWDDEQLLDHPQEYEHELGEMATFAVEVLRRVIFSDQWL